MRWRVASRISLNMQQLFPYLWRHVALPRRSVTLQNGPYLAVDRRAEERRESGEFSVGELLRPASSVSVYLVKYAGIISVRHTSSRPEFVRLEQDS